MNWIIKEKISESSFSNVYKVKHKKNEQIAALKVIHQALHNDSERRRFKRSFISTAKLNHPNLVKMIEWIETEDKIGFVMEYIDGKPLFNNKKGGDNLKEIKKIIPVVIQICNGLNMLHSNNIVHRDLKPANILLSKDNIVKITDFDLIKIKDQINLTMDGTFLGTIKYSSPEQCTNSSRVDNRSDLYSLGVILYQSITGRVPYDGGSFAEIALAHLNSTYINLKQLNPEIPDGLVDIVDKLLKKNPNERYNSAYNIISDLYKVFNYDEILLSDSLLKKYLLPSVFIGRRNEIDILNRLLKTVEDGKGKIIFISGETGIGKTRLWEEYKFDLCLKQIPVIDIYCKEKGYIYEPLKQIILQIIDSFSSISDLKKVKILGKLAWDLTNIAPELNDLDFMDMIEKIPSLSGEEAEIRLFEAIADLLINFSEVAYKTPSKFSIPAIVIYLDDIHLADEPVYRWLSYIAGKIQSSRILIIASLQEDILTKSKEDIFLFIKNSIKKEGLINVISLKPFNTDEISIMLKSILSNDVEYDVVEEILRKTEGNPLFINEIIQNLYVKNKIKFDNTKVLIDLQFIKKYQSESLTNFIKRRLQSIKAENLKILQAASIIGEIFNIDDLIKIFNFDEVEVIEILEECRYLNYIEYDTDINCYKFIHSPLREIILTEIDEINKIRYHKIAAEFIKREVENKENDFSTDKNSDKELNEKIDKLPFHYKSAGDYLNALKYSIKAGEIAKSKFANEKALSHYRNAICFAKIEGEITSEIESLLKLGEVLEVLSKFEEAKKSYFEAINLSKKNDKEKLFAESNYRLGKLYIILKDYINSKTYLQISEKKFNKEKNGIKFAYLKGDIGFTLMNIGEFDEALKYFKNQLKIGEKLENKRIISEAKNNIGNLYNLKGEFDEALKYYKSGLDISKGLTDKKNMSAGYLNIGNVYVYKNIDKKSNKYFEKFLNICDELDNKLGKAIGLISIGDLYAKNKEYNKALEYYMDSLKINIEISNKTYLSSTYGKIGNINLITKNFEQAKDNYKTAINNAKIINDKNKIVLFTSNLADIYYYLENFEKSIELYNEIITEEIKNLSDKNTFILRKIEILIDYNKIDKAKELLDSIISTEKKENKYENENLKTEILINLINYILKKDEIFIQNIENMLNVSKNEENKVEIYFYLWKVMRYFDNDKAYDYADKFLQYYRQLTDNYSNVYNLLRFYKVDRFFKNWDQKSIESIDDEFELIKNLTKLLKPETAYLEFLKYLKKSINTNSALLLTKDDTQPEYLIREKLCSEYEIGKINVQKNYIIKAITPELHSEDIDFSRSILLKAVESGKPIIISNALEQPELKDSPSIRTKSFLSVIAIPLIMSDEKIFGALYLDRREITKKPFERSDLNKAQKIADILSPILIEHEKVEETKHLSEIQKLGLFIGSTRSMKKLYKQIENCSKIDMFVYIYGETGSGKELVARALHKLSDRRDKPFIAINCSAIPPGLAETELFGYEKGAFSGATSSKKGKFELAEDGILFLDEIADLQLDIQAKLLRVLQEKEIWRVGGQKPVSVNARIFVSTHKNLIEKVKTNKFREDLYHRLNILKIDVPSLKERIDDIPLLAYHFLKKYNKTTSKEISGFTKKAIEKLQHYNWPGNIRELENIIAKIVVNHHGDDPIDFKELFIDDNQRKDFRISSLSISKNQSLQDLLDSTEKEIVEKVLIKNQWNISKSAKELKTSRVRLYKIIKKNNLTQ